MSEEQKNPPFDIRNSYLAMVRNSEDSGMFRNRYYKVWGESMDVLYDGDVACAVPVSSILFLHALIKEVHTKVSETIKDMEASGWYRTSVPSFGAVIHWGFKKNDDGSLRSHHHIGFLHDNRRALSNDSETGLLKVHDLDFGKIPSGQPRREIIAYYWHPALDS